MGSEKGHLHIMKTIPRCSGQVLGQFKGIIREASTKEEERHGELFEIKTKEVAERPGKRGK